MVDFKTWAVYGPSPDGVRVAIEPKHPEPDMSFAPYVFFSISTQARNTGTVTACLTSAEAAAMGRILMAAALDLDIAAAKKAASTVETCAEPT